MSPVTYCSENVNSSLAKLPEASVNFLGKIDHARTFRCSYETMNLMDVVKVDIL